MTMKLLGFAYDDEEGSIHWAYHTMTIKLLGFAYDDEEGSIHWAYHTMTIKLLDLIPHYDDQTVGLNTTL